MVVLRVDGEERAGGREPPDRQSRMTSEQVAGIDHDTTVAVVSALAWPTTPRRSWRRSSAIARIWLPRRGAIFDHAQYLLDDDERLTKTGALDGVGRDQLRARALEMLGGPPEQADDEAEQDDADEEDDA